MAPLHGGARAGVGRKAQDAGTVRARESSLRPRQRRVEIGAGEKPRPGKSEIREERLEADAAPFQDEPDGEGRVLQTLDPNRGLERSARRSRPSSRGRGARPSRRGGFRPPTSGTGRTRRRKAGSWHAPGTRRSRACGRSRERPAGRASGARSRRAAPAPRPATRWRRRAGGPASGGCRSPRPVERDPRAAEVELVQLQPPRHEGRFQSQRPLDRFVFRELQPHLPDRELEERPRADALGAGRERRLGEIHVELRRPFPEPDGGPLDDRLLELDVRAASLRRLPSAGGGPRSCPIRSRRPRRPPSGRRRETSGGSGSARRNMGIRGFRARQPRSRAPAGRAGRSRSRRRGPRTREGRGRGRSRRSGPAARAAPRERARSSAARAPESGRNGRRRTGRARRRARRAGRAGGPEPASARDAAGGDAGSARASAGGGGSSDRAPASPCRP